MSEERPTPKTKQQLISLLKDQLETVQDEINGMQDTLEEQRQKRKQLTQELEQKENKIKELIQTQTKTLGDKVNEGLYNTLEAANKMRADAQAQVRQFVQDNVVLNEKIIGKDTNLIQTRQQNLLISKRIGVQEQKRSDAKRKEENLVEKKQELRKILESMKKEHQRIEHEEKELRNHIENAKKLRLFLNKTLQGNVKSPNNLAKSRASNSDNFWNGAG